ncbi:SRPBCC family protein [Amycolatopsis sp.]|uniref:SRPBCC family protein n=1 Tax=Amycolatopsis sp. TaxID=37632 RepID=UPI002C919742|nr:SRPBCC family protein [Amycolatopsis sp.]HVV07997.1 SRPBCC family protein [Amycolatopsis sp.]
MGRSVSRKQAAAPAAVAGVTAVGVVSAVVHRRAGGRRTGGTRCAKRTGEVYAAWRKLEELARFMAHLESVRPVGDGTTHWRAAGVEWDAEITAESVGEYLERRTVGDSGVHNSGRVEFRAAPGGRGTEVRVRPAPCSRQRFSLPGCGRVGAAASATRTVPAIAFGRFGIGPPRSSKVDRRRLLRRSPPTRASARTAGASGRTGFRAGRSRPPVQAPSHAK